MQQDDKKRPQSDTQEKAAENAKGYEQPTALSAEDLENVAGGCGVCISGSNAV